MKVFEQFLFGLLVLEYLKDENFSHESLDKIKIATKIFVD